MSGCTSNDDDEIIPDLPDDDPATEDTGDFDFPIDSDTATGPLDDIPANWLYMYHDGEWDLGPTDGPYTTLSGTLEIFEFVDFQLPRRDDTDIVDTDLDDTDTSEPWDDLEKSPLLCRANFTLSAEPSETNCSGCDFTLDLTFHLIDGDPSTCLDPDVPDDGDVRRFGWRASDDVILYDYYNAGIWFPWYKAEKLDDHLSFRWYNRLAISVEEEDEG
ncbi:MAG: hypothetical protein ACI9MC_003187 [Kiritimatiellia bacterium]|jgi:hypothetical protein